MAKEKKKRVFKTDRKPTKSSNIIVGGVYIGKTAGTRTVVSVVGTHVTYTTHGAVRQSKYRDADGNSISALQSFTNWASGGITPDGSRWDHVSKTKPRKAKPGIVSSLPVSEGATTNTID
jgi:hypothetical protein